MLQIVISSDGEQVQDKVFKENTDMQEVAVVLLRLKQIEQMLIDMEFEDDYEVEG